MSPYIRGLGCGGWPYCVNCGGVCSTDDYDDLPYRPGLHPKTQGPERYAPSDLRRWSVPVLPRLANGQFDYSAPPPEKCTTCLEWGRERCAAHREGAWQRR